MHVLEHSPVRRPTWGAKASRVVITTLLLSALAVSHAEASFSQQSKLVGSGAVGSAQQGTSVALSTDGNTAIVGGYADNGGAGAAWVWTRSGGLWNPQGGKLVGTGAVGSASQGISVALSADGNTAIVGGSGDNSNAGAAWVYTRSGGVWTQQGAKLTGTGAVGSAHQGTHVALSADGNTAIIGGYSDNSSAGAAWVFTRSGGVWTQQGAKLVGTGAAGGAHQGDGVALSADGNTAVIGGPNDNSAKGATWVFTRSGGVWTQQGTKLVGTGGALGAVNQGGSVAVSADGNTAAVGGDQDNNTTGATWVFTRSGGVWSQQGGKLVGTGAGTFPSQGFSVALSGDGNVLITGGLTDSGNVGAAWVFSRTGGGWHQYGSKLVGNAVGNAQQGGSVGLSADGKTGIVGGYLDNSSAGAAWVYLAPPELIAGGAAGWYAPSLPYKSGVGNTSTAPTVLDGNVNNTIFAYNYSNTGPLTASSFVTNEYIDGALTFSWTPGSLPPGTGAQWNSSPRTVRGGLHTMGFENDVTNVIDELDETNNNHASQWVWSPLAMSLGVPMPRPTPPDPQGGWLDIPIGQPHYNNVDGLRSPAWLNQWGAIAVAPTDAATSPDLQVYRTLSTGPANGFRIPDEVSTRPGDVTDLVVSEIQNVSVTLDVGLYATSGSAPVEVQAVSSVPLVESGQVSDVYGPFSLGPDSLVALFSLGNGAVADRRISLQNLSGNANLDFMVFGHSDPTGLYNTTEAFATAAATGDGGDELYKGTVPAQPAMAVIKAGSSDVAKTALFRIIIGILPDAVGADPPSRVALGPITPNPAHGGTTLTLDLPRAMPIDLAAYDVNGRRVSTLANGAWGAGRHAIHWSTLGDGGERLPNGVYLVQLRAGETRTARRVLVIR